MEPALELRAVSKRFGAIAAADSVSLSVAPGEVLALVGENGAGKSTLINVACGLYRADAGTVHVLGRELPPGDPRAAIDAGLGVIFQELMLAGPLRVWENVVLGNEPRRLGRIDEMRARREVERCAEQLGFELRVDARVGDLGIAAQQRVEIVKQFWRGARVLVLDEPTAALGPAEAGALLRTVRALASGGRSALFVTHKLREVLAVADRIAVLRRGRLVLTTEPSRTDPLQLARAVMGVDPGQVPREALAEIGLDDRSPISASPDAPAVRADGDRPGKRDDARRPEMRAGIPDRLGDIVGRAERASEETKSARLVVRDLRCAPGPGRPGLRGVSFVLGPGEVVGLAGVDGNGQTELVEVLTGLRRASGELLLDGADGLRAGGWARSAASARRSGVVHLPEDRQRRGLCLPMTAEENLALGRHRDAPYARGPLIDARGRRRKAEELIAALDVRPPDPVARVAALSGGNQQKLVAARELRGGATPRLVVAAQPTRGLDVRATLAVHQALRSARASGAAVVLSSLDLDELRSLCDRLLVIVEGRIAGELPPGTSDDTVGRLMLAHEPARA